MITCAIFFLVVCALQCQISYSQRITVATELSPGFKFYLTGSTCGPDPACEAAYASEPASDPTRHLGVVYVTTLTALTNLTVPVFGFIFPIYIFVFQNRLFLL